MRLCRNKVFDVTRYYLTILHQIFVDKRRPAKRDIELPRGAGEIMEIAPRPAI